MLIRKPKMKKEIRKFLVTAEEVRVWEPQMWGTLHCINMAIPRATAGRTRGEIILILPYVNHALQRCSVHNLYHHISCPHHAIYPLSTHMDHGHMQWSAAGSPQLIVWKTLLQDVFDIIVIYTLWYTQVFMVSWLRSLNPIMSINKRCIRTLLTVGLFFLSVN